MSATAETLAQLHEHFGWGDLPHHDSECDDCTGIGETDADECDVCAGEGRIRWGSFYANDTGQCDVCKREDVRVSGGLYEGQWTCLPCYLVDHLTTCGCELFGAAEELLGLDVKRSA